MAPTLGIHRSSSSLSLKLTPPRATSSAQSSSAGLGASRGYTEVRAIGKGSYGVATLAQNGEGKLCVIKAVSIGRLDHKQQQDAFNEVAVLSSLKHPYIVRYFESFIENGTLAIVMDYAAGGDLHQRILRAKESRVAFSEPQILTWFTQAVIGLKYLHSKQIIHRDLKAQNLFLTDRDQLRIGDFGISKVLKRTAATEEGPIGTPYYMSPEVHTDGLYTFASDIWALGCVLYELAVLKVPFEAGSIPSLVQKITESPAPALPYSYSSDLRILGRDLLHRDHRQRPPTSDIVRRPVVQREIARMLREVREQDSATSSLSSTVLAAEQGGGSSAGSDLQSTRRLLGNERRSSDATSCGGALDLRPQAFLGGLGGAAEQQPSSGGVLMRPPSRGALGGDGPTRATLLRASSRGALGETGTLLRSGAALSGKAGGLGGGGPGSSGNSPDASSCGSTLKERSGLLLRANSAALLGAGADAACIGRSSPCRRSSAPFPAYRAERAASRQRVRPIGGAFQGLH